MKQLTERDFSASFENCLFHGPLRDVFQFSHVFQEVCCQQGRVDLVATVGHIGTVSPLTAVSCGSSATVLSLLKPRAPRTQRYLIERTGLTATTVKKALVRLENADLVIRTKSDLYLLADCDAFLEEIWAFEVKINNWKRALFQAMQSRAFANYAIAVFPRNKTSVLLEHAPRFRSLRIGLMVYDASSDEYEFLVKPCKTKPFSKRHRLYAQGQLANRIIQDQPLNMLRVN